MHTHIHTHISQLICLIDKTQSAMSMDQTFFKIYLISKGFLVVLQIGVLTRMIIGLLNFVEHLREDAFFGPNTFKTTIALSAVIFVLLLTSHFEAPSGSPQRVYIEELTGTVMFDLIDTVSS